MDNQPPTQPTVPIPPNEPINSVQPVVSPEPQQAVPPQPEKQSSIKRLLKILLISFIVIVVGGVAFVAIYIIGIVGGLHSGLSSCSQGRTQLFATTQLVTNEFNSIAFVPSQPNVKASISKQQGDCVDSLPTIFGTKKYVLPPMPAGTVFDQASAALQKDGYSAASDGFPDLNPCSYADKPYSFTKGNQTIQIALTCSAYVGKDPNWTQTPATGLAVSLSDEWQYPQNKQ